MTIQSLATSTRGHDNSSTHIWSGLKRGTMWFLLRMRLLSSCCIFSSSYCHWVLTSSSYIASLFFFNSSTSQWRTTAPCFSASSYWHSTCPPADGVFRGGVATIAFLKKVALELFCEMTLETTSVVVNGGCRSATVSTWIVSIGIYKMQRWTNSLLTIVKERSVLN